MKSRGFILIDKNNLYNINRSYNNHLNSLKKIKNNSKKLRDMKLIGKNLYAKLKFKALES